MNITAPRKDGLMVRVKRTAICLLIRMLDRQYIQLNKDLNWLEDELKRSKKAAEQSRITLLKRRSRLRVQLIDLGGN
ncbi:MAG: hypothetical protein WA071_27935 [Undibacterium umbellatum]|uniref:hypothetical protein n=1 Tax=Undibacterium umbellatum TaxID=2762300 RepID=UPI003BB5AE1F